METTLFRDLKLGDTFVEGQKYIKISDNQAMSVDFGIERFYGEDEVEQVTNPNECLYLIEGSST